MLQILVQSLCRHHHTQYPLQPAILYNILYMYNYNITLTFSVTSSITVGLSSANASSSSAGGDDDSPCVLYCTVTSRDGYKIKYSLVPRRSCPFGAKDCLAQLTHFLGTGSKSAENNQIGQAATLLHCH